MLRRTLTAIVIILIVIPPLYFGGYLLYGLMSAVIIAGGYEILKLNSNWKIWSKLLIGFFLIYTVISVFLPRALTLMAIGLLIIILLSVPIFSKNFTSEDSLYLMGVYTIFLIFPKAFLYIYNINNLYIWYILVATYGCDTGAYFIGSKFGKNKLIPEISPNKTKEGAIGGWATGAVLSFIFGILLIGKNDLLVLVLGSLWIPVVSQFGDLAFSSIKRHFNIKDFSNIFPGHGGVLDRIDSLIFSLIFFWIILLLVVML